MLRITRGEELGLPEVPDIPASARQDPTFFRTHGAEIGRDGCRIPLPWTKSSKNFGFGAGAPAHLPQPEWMGEFAVDVLEKDANSTLAMYKKALALRRELQAKEDMDWVDGPAGMGQKEVLHFKREGGWEVIMNFDGDGVEVPLGAEVLVQSGIRELEGRVVPKNTTVWFRR